MGVITRKEESGGSHYEEFVEYALIALIIGRERGNGVVQQALLLSCSFRFRKKEVVERAACLNF